MVIDLLLLFALILLLLPKELLVNMLEVLDEFTLFDDDEFGKLVSVLLFDEFLNDVRSLVLLLLLLFKPSGFDEVLGLL